jgi:inosose dehydratase
MDRSDPHPIAMSFAIAGAPCSYGAFEATIGVDPNVPDGVTVLDALADARYAGVDLGPVGYLGLGERLAERLRARSLVLCGGYVPLPFSDPAALAQVLGYVDALLDVFDYCPDGVTPRPTLADAGSPERLANPGAAAGRPELGLGADGWRRLADGVSRAAERCRERGYEPTFHHHTGTYVEAAWEIERMLELTDVGLCLDTGHIVIAGGDPLRALADWSERINHLHVKDVHRDVVAGIVAEGAHTNAIWSREAFCRLGEGDLDLDRFLERVKHSGYAGWLLVEQDIFPDREGFAERAAMDQRANREWLAARGL